jgi:hypothetical protein
MQTSSDMTPEQLKAENEKLKAEIEQQRMLLIQLKQQQQLSRPNVIMLLPQLSLPIVQLQPAFQVQTKTNTATQTLNNDDKDAESSNRVKRVHYFNAKKSMRSYIRRELLHDVKRLVKKLRIRGLSFSNLNVFDDENESSNNVDLKIVQETLDPSEVLYQKDHLLVSDHSYETLCKLAPRWPTLSRVKLFRKRMKQEFPVKMAQHGVYNSPEVKISKMFQLHRHQIKTITDEQGSKTIRIKVSADGAQIANNSKLLNVTFSFLDQFSGIFFVDANFTLGIFDRHKENYETIRACTLELFEELSSLRTITIGEEVFLIEFFLVLMRKCLQFFLEFRPQMGVIHAFIANVTRTNFMIRIVTGR